MEAIIQIFKIKNEILGFIYSVRNNIFHGTKTTIEMSDKNQRKRLDIYSNILIAVNELLFKSDFESLKKYINEAPFTSVLGNDSPPRTGIWLGYRIILSYAKSQKLSLNEILQNENAQEILNQSKYRPGR